MVAWLKKSWYWLVGAAAVVIGLIVAILSFGRVRPTPPPVPKRPDLPDVNIPLPPPIDTQPADEYEADKDQPTKPDELVDSINNRYE